MTKVLQVNNYDNQLHVVMQFLRRFSLAIGSSGDDAKFQETPGKSGELLSMHVDALSCSRRWLE